MAAAKLGESMSGPAVTGAVIYRSPLMVPTRLVAMNTLSSSESRLTVTLPSPASAKSRALRSNNAQLMAARIWAT